MELRRCNHLHFIQAIRSGGVQKVRNVDSRGRPGLVLKGLKDIYDSEDMKRSSNLSTHQLVDEYNDMAVDSDGMEIGSSYPPNVRKKTKKRKVDFEIFDHKCGNDGDGSDSDITLKQLKKGSKVKKRKVTDSDSVTVEQDYADSQPEEDESDLQETISSWISKVSKNLEGKKKSHKKSVPNQNPVKSEPILGSIDSLQSGGLRLPLAVKVEVYETEFLEPMEIISEPCDSSVICSGDVQIGTSEAVGNDPLDGSQLSLLGESEICVVNDVCYDQFEDIKDVFTDYPEMAFPQLAIFPFMENEENGIYKLTPEEVHTIIAIPFAEQTSDLHTDNSVLEMHTQANKISEIENPSNARESTASELHELNDDICEEPPLDYECVSLSTSLGSCNSLLAADNCLNHGIISVCGEDDLLSSLDPPVTHVGAGMERECSLDKIPIDSVDCSAAIEEEKCVSSPLDDGQNNSSDRNQSCEYADDISIPEMGNYNHTRPCHSPERLLSTRKVISPTSQERLCQAMKGVELIEDVDHFKCKGKLHFENSTDNDSLTKEQDAECTKVHTPLGRKDVTRPKRNTNEKVFPTKSNQKSPNLSRSLPNFSSGIKSLQRCTDSAITFSQRQMHDFECLATKLMQELNSMRGIIEGELHCETSPTKTLKCNVDEVSMAINSARKSEETTRKWLSMMTKDCNRFCTIMKLIEKGEVASPNNTHKERRKLMFADEAGGVLCHVKIFEDGMASPNSQT